MKVSVSVGKEEGEGRGERVRAFEELAGKMERGSG